MLKRHWEGRGGHESLTSIPYPLQRSLFDVSNETKSRLLLLRFKTGLEEENMQPCLKALLHYVVVLGVRNMSQTYHFLDHVPRLTLRVQR